MWRVRAWRWPRGCRGNQERSGERPGAPGRGAAVTRGTERPAGLARAGVRHGGKGEGRSAQPREGNVIRAASMRAATCQRNGCLHPGEFLMNPCGAGSSVSCSWSAVGTALVRVPWNEAASASARREETRPARCPRSAIPVGTAFLNSAPHSGAPGNAGIHAVPFHPHHRRPAPSCSPKAKNSTTVRPSPIRPRARRLAAPLIRSWSALRRNNSRGSHSVAEPFRRVCPKRGKRPPAPRHAFQTAPFPQYADERNAQQAVQPLA